MQLFKHSRTLHGQANINLRKDAVQLHCRRRNSLNINRKSSKQGRKYNKTNKKRHFSRIGCAIRSIANSPEHINNCSEGEHRGNRHGEKRCLLDRRMRIDAD